MDYYGIGQIVLGLMLGVGLSAAAGFRVFLPFLCLSAAAYFHLWSVPSNMLWTGTLPALVLFSTAALVETAAYYIPWVDNLLDTIATPTAAIAGSILTASAIGGDHVPPMLQWSAGIVAGGTTAALVSGGTSITRAASSLTTGGVANPILSTSEIIGSIFFSALAIIFPIIAGISVLVLTFFTGRFLWKRFRRKNETPMQL
ncbi:MAG: hypothetical protein RI894_828 [Bacteroidota bacterium]|jgi:hypothetical protein